MIKVTLIEKGQATMFEMVQMRFIDEGMEPGLVMTAKTTGTEYWVDDMEDAKLVFEHVTECIRNGTHHVTVDKSKPIEKQG